MIYVVSDLHGYPLEKFKEHLSSVGFSDDDFLYVLGDVIDRGSDGIKILQWLMEMPNAELILGNHEATLMACDFIFEEITDDSIGLLSFEKMGVLSTWLSNGGEPTMAALKNLSYDERADILDYLSDAPLYEAVTVNDKDFVLIHSGFGSFRKDKKLSEYSKDDLIWTRPSLDDRYFDEVLTVFGHTPTVYYGEEYKGRAVVTDTWINVDAGVAEGFCPMILRLDDLKEFYFDEDTN